MKVSPKPRLHVFVCANRRMGSVLGSGCAERGDAIYDALKKLVADRGEIASTWITKTHCLGICPKEGATVARYSSRTREVVSEVSIEDVPALVIDRGGEDDLERVIDDLEALQRQKVLDLARRLKPGLTLEDVQNPHDFPELDDPDWHYADGVLTGIASVRSAVRAVIRSNDP